MNEALESHDTIMRLLLSRFRGYEVRVQSDDGLVAG